MVFFDCYCVTADDGMTTCHINLQNEQQLRWSVSLKSATGKDNKIGTICMRRVGSACCALKITQGSLAASIFTLTSPIEIVFTATA